MKKKLLILSLFGVCVLSNAVNANPGSLGGGVVKPAVIMDCIYDAKNGRYICKKPN